MSEIKANRTRNLRYKRSALASMGWDAIWQELEDIQEACSNVHWFFDQDGDETLLNALNGDEEDEWEFKMAFADLEAKADQLCDALRYQFDWRTRDDPERDFNDCTVALIGNRYKTIGFDVEEEDYFSLTGYDQELAYTEAGKRLMRKTKAEMISTIGQCVGILVAFLDLRQQYDYLKATFDILRDENTSLLKQVKEIEAAYEAMVTADWAERPAAEKRFDQLLDCLPEGRGWNDRRLQHGLYGGHAGDAGQVL